MSTNIEWAEETWNPITGCSKISEGCQNCYAERMAKRLSGRYGYPPKPNHFRPTYHSDRLSQPLEWKKSRRIFVVSMGDLFHGDVEVDGYAINSIFNTMMDAGQHTYILLTKRPRNMRAALYHFFDGLKPPKNWWLGVTAENQNRYDERWPVLAQIPAAVLFVSGEPLLGSIDILKHDRKPDWFIVGGESGPGARTIHPDWVRSLRDQCVDAGILFMFKQWGEYCAPKQMPEDTYRGWDYHHGTEGWNGDEWDRFRVGKKKAGRLLDGKIWDQYPEA